jgi:hypothetical protein
MLNEGGDLRGKTDKIPPDGGSKQRVTDEGKVHSFIT